MCTCLLSGTMLHTDSTIMLGNRKREEENIGVLVIISLFLATVPPLLKVPLSLCHFQLTYQTKSSAVCNHKC